MFVCSVSGVVRFLRSCFQECKFLELGGLYRHSAQVSHAHQIVGGTSEGEDPVHFAHPAMPNLPHQRDRLQPAETFFDPLPLSLADAITRVPGGAPINRASASPSQVLRHVRRHPQVPALRHETERVVAFVPAHRHRLVPGILSIMTSAASRSAVPLAWNTSLFTISPLRFSTNRFPL